jgi:O-antigen chain-terminating methyltransferase
VSESLEDRLARLERERQEADRQYNTALTELDRAMAAPAESVPPPAAADASRLADLNTSWNLLAGGAPAIDRSLKGRLRGFIWRLVAPLFDAQTRFNSTLVEHVNRQAAADAETRAHAVRLAEVAAREAEALRHVQARLIQYLQTVTAYVDTKDRSTGARADIVNAGLNAITDDWLKRWESLSAREARFVQHVASLEDARTTAGIAQQTALALKREVERLLAGVPGTPTSTHDGDAPAAAPAAPAPDLNAFKYLSFEDAFRGSPEEISRRLAGYVPLFDGASDVLDLGCGRGEFLDLLRARGTGARGLDSNHAMVEACRERGLDVTEGDALQYLRGLDDGALGGLFATQVVEHLPPAYLMELVETAAHKLRPGSLIVLETINPACWLAFFESYIRDLTHVRPLHPETLQHLLRVSGFQEVRVEYLSPVAESARLDTVGRPADSPPGPLTDLIDTFNENAAKLNGRLFTYQDYAAIGRRA